MKRGFLTIYAGENAAVLRALSAPARVDMLKLLCAKGAMNVNEIARELDLPQSTVATGIMILEEAGLVETKAAKARKGYQKICTALYDEILLSFEDTAFKHDEDVIEVAMPIGLYTSCETHAPCGLCSTEGVIGLLDVPDYFLDPQRMQAAFSGSAAAMWSINFPTMPRS